MEKRKSIDQKSKSSFKKSKIIDIDIDINNETTSNRSEINIISKEILIEIIKFIPITQWPHVEKVNRQFRQAVFGAWRSLQEIRLDQDFCLNYRLDRMFLLTSLLKKLYKRAPHIRSISGFSTLMKGTWIPISGSNLNSLARFEKLERVSLGNCPLWISTMVQFLKSLKNRQHLKELNLGVLSGSENLLRAAFEPISNRSLLRLEKIIFLHNSAMTFSFQDTIDVSKLTSLKFDVTVATFKNFILFLARCTELRKLEIDFRFIIDHDYFLSLASSIETLPSGNLSCFKFTFQSYTLAMIKSNLIKFIETLGRRYRLLEFSLMYLYACDNEIILAISDHLIYLKCLEIEIQSLSSDLPSLSYLVKKLTQMGKLAIYTSFGYRVVNGDLVSAMASNMKNLRSLHLDCVNGDASIFACLIELIELKELHIAHSNISDETLQIWSDGGMKLQTLELPGCQFSIDNGFIEFIKKQNKLRRLNLENAKMTNLGLKAIADWCPMLNELKLNYCNDESLPWIQAIVDGCQMLQRLVILHRQSSIDRLKISKYRKLKYV